MWPPKVPANPTFLWAHENASSTSGSTGAWGFSTASTQIQDIPLLYPSSPGYQPNQHANFHGPFSGLPNLLWSTHFCWSGTGSTWGDTYTEHPCLLLTLGVVLGAFSEHGRSFWGWCEVFRDWSTCDPICSTSYRHKKKTWVSRYWAQTSPSYHCWGGSWSPLTVLTWVFIDQ